MKIEKLFPGSEFERWLNVQVARHLEAQAATFRSAGRPEISELIHANASCAKEDRVNA